MTTRININDMVSDKITQPYLASTGIDDKVLKKLDYTINRIIKNYNNKNREITSIKKEINVLRKDKDNNNNEDKLKNLENQLINHSNEIKRYEELIMSGQLPIDIIDELTNVEVKNPNNVLKDNLQLISYEGAGVDLSTKEKSVNYTQNLIKTKFKLNMYQQEYASKNINPFDDINPLVNKLKS